MKRNKVSQVEDEIAHGKRYDDTLTRASADYYERSWNNRIKEKRSNIWIAVGLYLILSSFAFVVL